MSTVSHGRPTAWWVKPAAAISGAIGADVANATSWPAVAQAPGDRQQRVEVTRAGLRREQEAHPSIVRPRRRRRLESP